MEIRKIIAVTAAVCIIGLAGRFAQGGLISIDIDGRAGDDPVPTTYSGSGPLTGASDGSVWSSVYVDWTTSQPLSAVSLVDSYGNSTPVTFAMDVWFGSDRFPGGPYGTHALYCDYIVHYDSGDSNAVPTIFTVAGLVPGESYDLAVFTSNDGAGFGAKISVNGGAINTATGNAVNPIFQDGEDMILFSAATGDAVTADSQGKLNISITGENFIGGYGWGAVITGLQISGSVPEPATISLVGLGTLGLLFRRRNK